MRVFQTITEFRIFTQVSEVEFLNFFFDNHEAEILSVSAVDALRVNVGASRRRSEWTDCNLNKYHEAVLPGHHRLEKLES